MGAHLQVAFFKAGGKKEREGLIPHFLKWQLAETQDKIRIIQSPQWTGVTADDRGQVTKLGHLR